MPLETKEGLGGRGIVILAVVLITIIGALIVSEYSFRGSRFPGGGTISSSSISIDKPSPAYYATGEVIKLEFSVADYTVGNLTISSPNQCLFGFRIRVTDPQGPVVYDSTKHLDCSGPPFKTTLGPGKNFTSGPGMWNQFDDNGTQVAYGRYEVMGYYMGSTNPLIPSGEVVAGAIYFGKPAPVSPQEFFQNYYILLSTDEAAYSQGKVVRINEGVANNGPKVDSFAIPPCSFSYEIFSLKDTLVFDSLLHRSCAGSPVDSLIAPQGGLWDSAYWNQTDNSGVAVPLGLYHIVEHAKLVSGGRELNATKRLDILVGSFQTSGEEIIILSSSICSLSSGVIRQSPNSTNLSGCPGSGPSLFANVRVQGELQSIQLFLNGV